jgi:orotate phosphoribosyltransferase
MGATMGQSARARQILVEAGAVLTGDHFVYVTGDHGDGWIDKDVIFPRTDITSELCHMLAEAVGHIGIDYVCGPATGGLIVSQWTGHHLGVPSLFAQHDDDVARADAAGGALRPPFVLARGYDQLVCGARVLVVDDVINTGHSIRQTADAVADAGGEVVAAAALCTRGNTTAEDLRCSEFVYLTEILIPSWPAAECRLCTEGVPINTRCAHGQDFLAGGRSNGART